MLFLWWSHKLEFISIPMFVGYKLVAGLQNGKYIYVEWNFTYKNVFWAYVMHLVPIKSSSSKRNGHKIAYIRENQPRKKQVYQHKLVNLLHKLICNPM